MNKPSWSRAYYVVVAAACFVISLTTLTAADAGARIPPLLIGDGQSPPITKVFVQFSAPVYYVAGGTALILIGVLAVYRRRAISAVLSTVILVICVSFDMIALWALQMPIVGKLYGMLPNGMLPK